MPQPFNNAVITNSGARLLTRAQAGELKIEFTRIAVGNGEYTEDEKTLSALQIQMDLKASQNSYPISDLEVYSDYSVKVTALITNLDPVTGKTLVNAGYFINEMGLFAKEKDGEPDTEVLYSIAVTAGDNGDFMPPYNGYNPAQITQEYFATVNNSSEVYIQTAGAAALAEDVISIRQDVERLKQNGAAGQYSDQIQYHAGEYCIHEGILYKCIQDTAGEWNPEYWQKTSPMEEIENLKKEISGQISMIDSLSNILGTDQSGELDWVMQGASSSASGKSGLVPAPGKGMQEAVLLGKGAWGNLGAAAFAGIANNRTTTEPGFLADARQLKAIQDVLDVQNSALGTNIPENAYVYVFKTSRKSFKDAAEVTAADNVIGTLDILHASINSYKSGMVHVFNENQHYPVMLICLSDAGGSGSGYCGWIWKYNADIKNLPVFFVFYGGYSLFMPQKI